ncbi:MAG: hypothetical protein ACJAUV_001140 [Flavobacteriales bacterium]|jgi:hypothetical protein
MSNKSSDALFKLIKSLSKAEKRYFKIYTSRHTLGEANNYHQLFEFIDKLEEYEEESILKHFKNEAFINRLSIAKSRLYDVILKSLDGYYANSSVEARIKKEVHYVEILYKKSLYTQASKQLRSVKKLALKNEKYSSLIEIQVWEKLLIEKDNYEGVSKKKLNTILLNDEDYLTKITSFSRLWNIKSILLRHLFTKGKARSRAQIKQFKEIIDKTLNKINFDTLSENSKYLYYHIYSAYYFAVSDYQKSYDYLILNEELIRNNTHLFKEEPNIYASVLTNLVYICQQQLKIEEAMSYLLILRKLPETLKVKSNEDLDLRIFASTYSIELTMYAITGEFKKGLDFLPVVEEGLKLYDNKLSAIRKASFYFNIAVLHFGVADYNNALKWLNRLLNDIDIDQTEDLHCFAQMLNLIVHIELSSERLLPYALRSTQRYLVTRNRVYKFESIFLIFINKVIKAKDIEQQEEAIQVLLDDISPLENDNFESNAFEYFDFISWAKSKISKQTFEEVIKQKHVS